MARKPRKSKTARIAAEQAEGRLLAVGDAETAAPERGRPIVYRPEYAALAKKLCKAGHTDRELADFFEVSISTILNWKAEYPDFLSSIQSAKDVADERVERSLYHRAIGYTFEAEEVFQYQGEIVRAKVRKHMPPDTGAAIFWLKNRRKDAWRDVQRHEFGRAGEFEKLSDTELVTELAKTAQLLLEDKSEPEEK
jgi:hypothetical protein